MAIQDITKPMALDETLQGTNTKMDGVIEKLQGIIDALGLDTSVYKPKGNIVCAALIPALLIEDNLGNVYNVTDNGTTTSDFVEGAGKPIHVGDNVAIVDVGTGGQSEYKFDLLAGMVDLSNYIQKSATSGLMKNDGSVDTNSYATTSQIPDITGKADKVASAVSGNFAALDVNGDLVDSGINSNIAPGFENEHLWYIGDSFLVAANGWGAKIDNKLSLSNSYYTADGGVGFVNVGNTWGVDMPTHISALSDVPTTITKVIVVLGVGDCKAANISTLSDKIVALHTVIRNKAPKALIYYVFNGTYASREYSDYENRIGYVGIVYNTITRTVMGLNKGFMLQSPTFVIQSKALSSDGVHLTDTGYGILANTIISGMYGHDVDLPMTYEAYGLYWTIGAKNFITLASKIRGNLYNGSAINIPSSGGIFIENDADYPYQPKYYDQIAFRASLRFTNSSDVDTVVKDCSLMFMTDGKIRIVAGQAISNVKHIEFDAFLSKCVPYFNTIS